MPAISSSSSMRAGRALPTRMAGSWRLAFGSAGAARSAYDGHQRLRRSRVLPRERRIAAWPVHLGADPGHGWGRLSPRRGKSARRLIFMNMWARFSRARVGPGEWGSGRQNPQLFSTGSLFALAHREVPKPQPLDQFEWEDLKRDHREARKLYLGNQLEQASSKYRYCLRVIESPPQDDQTVRRLRGRLLAERARTSYRLGRPAAVEADLKLAESLTGDDPAALEVRGYLSYDGGQFDRAAGPARAGHRQPAGRWGCIRLSLLPPRHGDSITWNDSSRPRPTSSRPRRRANDSR